MRKLLSTILVCVAFCYGATAQGFQNPIIPGYFPDPSICCVGDDFYLVNSSFCYFPGVPIHHSKDLVNWQQIGNVLNRESQVNLKNTNFWTGIYAPTIRYDNGTFYMIVTNVTGENPNGNFLVYTDNPRGEWSDPVWLKQGGIDPSLYFENGKCYMVSNPDGAIWLCEIDPKSGKQLTDSKILWEGTGGRYPEAPHIYKKDGMYYLMIAEGGTEFGHKVTISRSKNIYGPYDPCPYNPIVTNFNMLGQSNPIQGTGHADLVEAKDGSWWLVCLAFRTQGGNYHNTGRETYLAPVVWPENGWPIVNGNGIISLDNHCKTLDLQPFEPRKSRINFDMKTFTPDWIFLRNPVSDNYELTGKKLKLKASYPGIEGPLSESPTFVARRQEHIKFDATIPAELNSAKEGDEGGLSIFQSENSHYDIALQCNKDGKYEIVVRYRLRDILHTAKIQPVVSNKVFLRVSGNEEHYIFSFSTDGKTFNELSRMSTTYLSSESAGGFTGNVISIFAAKKSAKSSATLSVEWFEYNGK